MTNAMIIFMQSVHLMNQGILHGTGKTVTVKNSDGTETVYEMPEQIHTFSAWKSLGYSVKKGEHACAAFHIWKYATRGNREQTATEEESAEEQGDNGRMLWKKAFFFKSSQVERLKTANA